MLKVPPLLVLAAALGCAGRAAVGPDNSERIEEAMAPAPAGESIPAGIALGGDAPPLALPEEWDAEPVYALPGGPARARGWFVDHGAFVPWGSPPEHGLRRQQVPRPPPSHIEKRPLGSTPGLLP